MLSRFGWACLKTIPSEWFLRMEALLAFFLGRSLGGGNLFGKASRAGEKMHEKQGNNKHMMHMAAGQNQWYHSGVGAPPILVYFSRDWVHWGYGVLAHGHVSPPGHSPPPAWRGWRGPQRPWSTGSPLGNIPPLFCGGGQFH